MWDGFFEFFRTGIPTPFLYSSIFVTIFLIILGLCLDCVKTKKNFVIWSLLLEYVFIVVCSNIVFRPLKMGARLELMPFWTYEAVFDNVIGVSIWDIVLNVVLFMPLGFLVKLIYPSLSLLKLLGIAVLCSLFIETNQYIFEKGVAQIDDVMHNVIGALLGWLIAKGILSSLRPARTTRC